MYEILLVVYLLVSLALIGLVMIQQGKGADMGASFGAGASNTVFGSGGSGSFLTRTTAILATLFSRLFTAMSKPPSALSVQAALFKFFTAATLTRVITTGQFFCPLHGNRPG